MSWEVGVWNKGVSGGGDGGIWISADVKNWFSTGWFGDTEGHYQIVYPPLLTYTYPNSPPPNPTQAK